MKHPHHRGTETRRKTKTWVQNVWKILVATLSEILDESAYQRFLARTGALRSKESYRAFLHERDAAIKPRCC